jgi:hypothetical protein
MKNHANNKEHEMTEDELRQYLDSNLISQALKKIDDLRYCILHQRLEEAFMHCQDIITLLHRQEIGKMADLKAAMELALKMVKNEIP